MRGGKTTSTTGKKSKKTGVSNVVKLDSVNPIPFEYGGQTFSFIHGAAYLPFLPPKDTFGQTLLEARLLSTTHNACVTTKRDYCAGAGFQDGGPDGKELPQEIIDFFKVMNLKNQSATGVNSAAFEDFFTYGNIPVEIVRFEVAGKRKLFVYVHPFLEWRLGKPDTSDIVHEAIQSKLFLRERANYLTADQIKNSKRLPIYSPLKTQKDNWFKDAKGAYRTIVWVKNPVSGFPYYGLPSAIASLIYQVLEYKGARYNLDNFDNNMILAGILALKGNLGDEEANKIATKILNQHSGDGKRGRTLVVASEQGIEGSDFHKISTETDGSYAESDGKWSDKIILANQWDAVLAGIINPTMLGKGANYLTKIIEHKLRTVIKPAQKKLVEDMWSVIFQIAEEWLGLPFSGYNLEIKNEIDISGLTDVDITSAVQVNEVRKAKGLQPDPAMDGVYMKPVAQKEQTPEEGGGELGKIPLAIQQLALAATRAQEVGDDKLSEKIQKKIDKLLERI